MKTQKIRGDSGVPTNSGLAVILAGLICFIGATQSFGEKEETQNLITKRYDILDLTMPVYDYPSPVILREVPPEAEHGRASLPPISGDVIVEIIKCLDKDWTDDKPIMFDANVGFLVVTQLPPVHKRIEEFLIYLRSICKPMISIEAKLVVIDNPTLYEIRERLPNTVILDDKALQTVLEKGSIYKTAQKTAYNGQEVYSADIKLIAYTRQYDVVIVNAASSKAQGEPIVDSICQGMVFGIKPFITPNKNIRMDIKLQNVKLVAIDKVNPVHYEEYKGNIELPTTDNTDIRTTVIAPSNKTILAGVVSLKESNKSMLLLVTPTLVGEESKTEYFNLTPTKSMKIFDVSSMTVPYDEHLFSPLSFPSLTPGGLRLIERLAYDLPWVPVYPIEGDEGIIGIIRNNIPVSWDDELPDGGRFCIIGETKRIAVIHKPDVIKKAEETIKLLSKPYDTSCLVTVNSQLLTISDAYWQGLIKDKKIDINKGFIDQKAVKDLLAETDKSKMVKLIASAEVTGFNKQSVCAGQMQQTHYVQDLDVQGGAIAYQPGIGILNSGVGLYAKPITLKDNFIDVLLDWRFANLIKMDTQTTQQGGFMFHKPQLETQLFMGNIKVQDGIWAIAQATSERDPAEGLQHNLILVKATVVK